MTTMHTDMGSSASSMDPVAEARPARPMVDMLGVVVSPLDMGDIVATITQWRSDPGARHYVCCVCVHGIVTAHRDPRIRAALNGASLATKDGMPVALWCRTRGFRNSQRVCGSDLMSALCAASVPHGTRHFFYGSTPAVLERLTTGLQERFPGLVVAGSYSPAVPPAVAGGGAG